MPFTSKTAIYGGRKKGAGRPRKTVTDAKREAAEVFQRAVIADALKHAQHYLKRSRKSDRVLCHLVEHNLLPEENVQAPTYRINFIKFDNDPSQLHSKDVSITVLASDEGKETSGQGVASTERQGQNGFKFLDFEDVS